MKAVLHLFRLALFTVLLRNFGALSIIPDFDSDNLPGANQRMVLGSRVGSGSPMRRCSRLANMLKNGSVKLRNRGRIAKFTCFPGYTMHGKTFATCLMGQWNNPLPICLAPGCPLLGVPQNGRQTSLYENGMLKYSCDPGYTLEGNPSVYCDGHTWNSSEVPKCVVAVVNPPLKCYFEKEDLCDWTNDDTDTNNFDWRRHHFTTPSGHVGTGPSHDHNMWPSSKAGYYLYLEASAPRVENDKARLFSPVYSPHMTPGCFVFWYHMYGKNTGFLNIYIKTEEQVFDELPPVFQLKGEQGNQWFRGTVDIPHLTTNFQIVVEGIIGNGYVGDTSIDDVSVRNTNCSQVRTDETSGEMIGSCEGRCSNRPSGNINNTCECNLRCETSANCCRDYWRICNPEKGSQSSSANPEDLKTVTISTTEQSDTFTTQPESPMTGSSILTTLKPPPTTVSTTTPKQTTTTTPEPITTTPKLTTTTPQPTTTTTPKPTTTTTPKPTTTTSKPTTTTSKPNTTTPKPTTTTPKPTTTTTMSTTSTFVPETTIRTTQSTTNTFVPETTTRTTQSTIATSKLIIISPIPTTTETTTVKPTSKHIPTTTISTTITTEPSSTSNEPTASLLTTTAKLQTITTTAKAPTYASNEITRSTLRTKAQTDSEEDLSEYDHSKEDDWDRDHEGNNPSTPQKEIEITPFDIRPKAKAFPSTKNLEPEEDKAIVIWPVLLCVLLLSVAVSLISLQAIRKWRLNRKSDDELKTLFSSDREEVLFS